MIRYEPTNVFHVHELIANLRPADRAEVEAARGVITPLQLWDDIRCGHPTTVLNAQRRVVCVYGVSTHPVQKHVGIVWLLGTDLLDEHMFQLCRETRAVLTEWRKKYAVLTNYTDKRNTRVLRWLRWLGFAFGSEINVRGHTFIQFTSH